MKNLNTKEKRSFIAAGLILLSVILMMIIIPGILNDESHPNPELAVKMGIIPAIILHLLILIVFAIIAGLNRRDGKNRKAGYIITGILLILLGLIYLDGAIAFSNNENILYVSYLMFGSVCCDLCASVLILISMSSQTNDKVA